MALQVLDPTNETSPPLGRPAPRLASFAGKTVGFISNGKEGTGGFFTHLDRMLRDEFGVAWLRLKLSKPGAVRGARAVGVVIERGTR